MRAFSRNWRTRGIVGGVWVAAGGMLVAGNANADNKTGGSEPLPNVMLLVDNSGSMENMIDPAVTVSCTPGTPSAPNRWGTLVQALSGTIPNFSCASMPRDPGSAFDSEYGITVGGTRKSAYDVGYYLPFHRPVAGTSTSTPCVMGPWHLPGAASSDGVGMPPLSSAGAADTFPPDAINAWPINSLLGGTVAMPVNKATLTPCTFEQTKDGALDSDRDLVRFGLMMFDSDTWSGTGVSASTPFSVVASLGPPGPPAVAPSPFNGMWSYYPGWNGSSWTGGPASGSPVGCNTTSLMEVGARNPAAPPWEGRMIGFPDPNGSLADLQTNNDNIKLVINASRPYGATPILGMLKDAQNYYWNDPKGPTQSDPYVGCRSQYIILLSDGAPNLDLRPSCDGLGSSGPPAVVAGICPYGQLTKPSTIADALWQPTGGQRPVKTFVIGFAASGNTAGGGVSTNVVIPNSSPTRSYSSCTTFMSSADWGTLPSVPNTNNACNPLLPADAPPAGSALEACCTLDEIALKGGSGHAYFADSKGDLNQALSAILGSIAKSTSSRVVPTYSPILSTSSGDTAFAASTTFLASFSAQSSGPWSGNIQRIRSVCPTPAVPAYSGEPINGGGDKGDDFSKNLNTRAAPIRHFFSVKDTSPSPDSSATIRPFLTTDDGVGLRTANEVPSSGVPNATQVITDLTVSTSMSALMGITATSCPKFTNQKTTDPLLAVNSALSAADCGKVALAFAMGQPDPGVTGTYHYDALSRAPGNGNCASTTGSGCSFPDNYSALGPILHSSPAYVSPPLGLLRDDSYQRFTEINKTRPPVLYVATLDGLLHAFDASTADTSWTFTTSAPVPTTSVPNNELWSFIPPAVLPLLISNYPGGQQNLLDGSPVVREAVWERDGTETTAEKWHTSLVAGFGQSARGYYALDVTDPVFTTGWKKETSLPVGPTTPSASPTTGPTGGTGGPHFLWQISNVPVAAGEVQLFGRKSVTPAITTMFIDSGSGPREVGVAILPGGLDVGPFGACDRKDSTWASTSSSGIPAGGFFDPRTKVRQWSPVDCNGGVSGRSVTIVRLDTGEIVRTFGRYGATPAYNDIPASIAAKSKVTNVSFDSPMTGTPIVFPSDTGAVTQKFYVGDADGTVWRFDVSNPSPSSWTATMFFDLYTPKAMQAAVLKAPPLSPPAPAPQITPPSTATHFAYAAQAATLPTVVSLDPGGNLLLTFATGDQEGFSATVADPTNPAAQVATYTFVWSIADVAGKATPKYYVPFGNGERVTGPMAIFDSQLYFATYSPGIAGVGAGVCTGGDARLYAMHYTNQPASCSIGLPSIGCGGAVPTTFSTLSGYVAGTPGFYPPSASDSALAGKIVPGVSVRATVSCSSSSTPSDTFSGGTYTSSSPVSKASYSLFANVGTSKQVQGVAGQTGATFEKALTTPARATSVDAWAGVVE